MIQNKIYTIIGHKGYGKTTLTELLVLLNKRPTVICDPRFQYGEKEYRRHFKNVAHFRKWISNAHNRSEFYRCNLELVVHVVDDEDFNELCEYVLKLKKISFLVDEVDMFADTRMTRKAKFYHLIHYGRHNQIDIFTTSRRPANISRNITSQTDITIFSKVREPADKKYIVNYIGKQHLEIAQSLDKFSFLVVDQSENSRVVKISKKVADTLK